jgi:cytochrome c-type biogenesis protein CcmH/NrfG
MGWITLALLGGGAMALLVWLKLGRALWSLAGAALMLGATGYALQGQPALEAHPAVPAAPSATDDAELIALREAMLGRFSGDEAYLVAADAMTRVGDKDAAVQVILGGIRAIPQSVLLWTGLGTALAAHDGGQVSPPALFAFQQAARLSPRHPAPPFFLGLAYIRSGKFAAARPSWVRALALTPDGASYRKDIAVRLDLLNRYLAMGGPPETQP